MKWRKLYLTAIKTLPDKWIDEETRVTTLSGNTVVAANPKFPPMIFKNNKWSDVEFEEKEYEMVTNNLYPTFCRLPQR